MFGGKRGKNGASLSPFSRVSYKKEKEIVQGQMTASAALSLAAGNLTLK